MLLRMGVCASPNVGIIIDGMVFPDPSDFLLCPYLTNTEVL
jgi:hypothetical protein